MIGACNNCLNDGRSTAESADFVIRTVRRAYVPPIVLATLITIVIDALCLIIRVQRHGWDTVPWSGLVMLSVIMSAPFIAIAIGLLAYKIRLSADTVEYRDSIFARTIRIGDIAAIYEGWLNNRPVIQLRSRNGRHGDIVINMLPFAGRDLEMFLQKLLARMPEDECVRRIKSGTSNRRRSHRRKSHNRNTLWLGLGLFFGVFSAVVFVFAAKSQHGPVGTVQFMLMVGGFLMSYVAYSMSFDYKYIMKAIGIRPRRWHGMVLCFLTFPPTQLLFAVLPVLFIQTSCRRYMPCAAFLGWVFGIVATRPAVRQALEMVCSRLLKSRKRGVQ